jgi:hypothetical protein
LRLVRHTIGAVGRRRSIPLVVAGVAVVVLVGAAVAAALVRWSGGLGGEYGNGVGLPVYVGHPFSVGMTRLRPASRVRIESIRLHGADGRVVLVGARLYPAGSESVGVARDYPPTPVHARGRAAEGAVIPPHGEFDLVVGLRAVGRGTFRVQGLDILYRERWHGLNLRRRSHTGVEIHGCAVAASSGLPHCTVPAFA